MSSPVLGVQEDGKRELSGQRRFSDAVWAVDGDSLSPIDDTALG